MIEISPQKIRFWANKTLEDSRAEKIFAFLANQYRIKQKLETYLVRPKLKNGKYSFQEIIKYKRSLTLPQFKLSTFFKQFIP